jgi:hypothetical protein
MAEIVLKKDPSAPRTAPSLPIPPRDTPDQHADVAHEPAANSGQARTPDRAKQSYSFEK